MPTCDNCDEHVSKRFHRVFSNRQGTIRACLHCSSGQEVRTQLRTYKSGRETG